MEFFTKVRRPKVSIEFGIISSCYDQGTSFISGVIIPRQVKVLNHGPLFAVPGPPKLGLAAKGGKKSKSL